MLSTTAEHEVEAAPAAPSRWFHGDVDGLRAIAIVLVVAYHAGLPHFAGGFIGVDVFFVISGFLISRNLLHETETTGRVALGRFWARRVRRLVPALALVVVVTLVAGAFILPQFDLANFSKQGASAALYVSNVLFAVQAKNYFAADISTSPFLHTWSLGVEEQFYLVWPVLFALAAWAGVRRRAARGGTSRRTLLIAVFGATFVASFALNLVLTASGSSWAFFSLPTRAWEFAVAGLLAALPVPGLLRSVAARTVLAVGGLAVLVVAMAVIGADTAYPGAWALLPVAAAVMLITAGETWRGEVATAPVSRVLSLPPMQWLGRVSYSWYLWHWPAIVLTVVALDKDRTGVKTAAALASLPVAALAYHYFETPVRFAKPIARSSRRTFVFGGAVTVAVLAVALVVWPGGTNVVTGYDATVAQLEGPPGASLKDRVNRSVAEYRTRSDTACPANSIKTSDGDDYCVGGDTGSDRTLMLIGDSHAGQWRRTMEQLAKAKGFKLLVREHNGCPIYRVDIDNGKPGSTETCRKQQAGDLRVIEALNPDAIIVSTWTGYGDTLRLPSGGKPNDEEKVQMWTQGATDFLSYLQTRGTPFGFVYDEPSLPMDASKCLTSKDSVAACEPTRAKAMVRSGPFLDAERSVIAKLGGVPTFDLTPIVCTEDACKLEIDGTLTYVDSHHLSDAFALKQAPLMGQLIDQVTPK